MTRGENELPNNYTTLRKRLRDAEEQLEEAREALRPRPPKGWWSQHIEPDKPRWTYILPILATFLGSLVAFSGVLWTLDANNYKMRVDRAETQYQFAVQQTETQFNAIQTRLANSDEKTRAAAALQLADMAIQAYPVRNSQAPLGFESKHYLFPRVATQFAISLSIEEKDSVRSAIKEGLRQMAATVKGAQPDDAVLRGVIEDMADANRTAKDNFIYALAVYSLGPQDSLAVEGSGFDQDFVAELVAFCDDPEKTKESLNALIGEHSPGSRQTKFALWREVRRNERLAMNAVERELTYSRRLPNVESSGWILLDSRDGLAIMLDAVSPSNINKVDLSRCFLAGADVHGISLEKIHLTGSYLQGIRE